jgi:CRP-like cAMP-binding protein
MSEHVFRDDALSAGHEQRARLPQPGLDSIAVVVRRSRGEEVQAVADSGEFWYRVMRGAAKCSVVLPGGRRQILDLLGPGDFFGFTPPGGHYCSVEALTDDTVVACYAKRRAEELARSNPQVACEICRMAFESVSRLQELLLIMGRTTAREKVASFLLKTKERNFPREDDGVVLLTSRYDIADYLALSVETVSRSLTELRHRGCIALLGPRRVRIVDERGMDEGLPNAGSTSLPSL